MTSFYIYVGVALVSLTLGVIFSPGIARLFAILFFDVKAEYTKGLAEAKAIFDADKAALEVEVKNIVKVYDDVVAKLKADLGEANNKVTVLTSVIKGATVLAPAATPPALVANWALHVSDPVTRTKAQIAADLATTQATEAQLQADLAAATE